MEELSAALKGKPTNDCLVEHVSSYDLSADSLEIASQNTQQIREGKDRRELEEDTYSKNDFFYLNKSEASSNVSIQSEPVRSRSKTKTDFITVAMADYLNSHRHSLSSVMELIDTRSFMEKTGYVHKSLEATDEEVEDEMFQFQNRDEQVYEESENHPDPFYILSPIEEKSEPSTGSSSLKGSNGSDKRKYGYDYHIGKYSSSCNAISYNNPSNFKESSEKFKTFPRIKSEDTYREKFYSGYYDHMYSLEPRELDPNSFFQLHTADSQEELQEFLLLESECMDDSTRDNGLASAFLSSTDEPSDLFTNSNKGNTYSNVCAAY